MIKINNINKSYGSDNILINLNYRFKTGFIYKMIGKNCTGKTTLLKVIMRLIRENKGSEKI